MACTWFLSKHYIPEVDEPPCVRECEKSKNEKFDYRFFFFSCFSSQILPQRLDWEANSHNQRFEELVSIFGFRVGSWSGHFFEGCDRILEFFYRDRERKEELTLLRIVARPIERGLGKTSKSPLRPLCATPSRCFSGDIPHYRAIAQEYVSHSTPVLPMGVDARPFYSSLINEYIYSELIFRIESTARRVGKRHWSVHLRSSAIGRTEETTFGEV